MREDEAHSLNDRDGNADNDDHAGRYAPDERHVEERTEVYVRYHQR